MFSYLSQNIKISLSIRKQCLLKFSFLPMVSPNNSASSDASIVRNSLPEAFCKKDVFKTCTRFFKKTNSFMQSQSNAINTFCQQANQSNPHFLLQAFINLQIQKIYITRNFDNLVDLLFLLIKLFPIAKLHISNDHVRT